MRLAHFSDPHVLSPVGVAPRRFFNKRATGQAHLAWKRGRRYRPPHLLAVLRGIAAGAFDHVVLTGDVTNLSLEPEFERAAELLTVELGLPPERLSVIPGNHDVYTVGSFVKRRYRAFLGPWSESDLPALGVELPTGRFPFVRLRGPVALIGLSSAVPRPPFVAAGRLGAAQLEALAQVVADPEVTARLPVILIHHPARDPRSALGELLDGLDDAEALLRALAPLRRGLLLHGHLHRRGWRRLPTRGGEIWQVGATCAALEDPDPDCRAGYNVYTITDGGAVEPPRAEILDAQGRHFTSVAVPERR